MARERDLQKLLSTMRPELHANPYVFVTTSAVPEGVIPVVMVREDEGLTLVLEQGQADELGFRYDYVAAMVTLRVHSALDAVGLTAAVASRLAQAGLSCNVVAGYHHDHLFVPFSERTIAMEVLQQLVAELS